jgi:hypothetical protein
MVYIAATLFYKTWLSLVVQSDILITFAERVT